MPFLHAYRFNLILGKVFILSFHFVLFPFEKALMKAKKQRNESDSSQ